MGDQSDGKITREAVAEVMVQAMNFESAKGKVFEVYSVADIPTYDWENFISGLRPEYNRQIRLQNARQTTITVN
jgi:hypothetical protein